MQISRWTVSVLLAGVLLTGGNLSRLPAADDPTWPQWRGPNRDGKVLSGSWPDSLGEPRLKPLWRVELPPRLRILFVNEIAGSGR